MPLLYSLSVKIANQVVRLQQFMHYKLERLNESMASSMNQFFKGRSVFITGATGFLGKVLLEKLLRTCPDVRAVYILIRPKKGKDVAQRKNELLSSKAFDRIKANNSTLLEKIKALNGDISLPLLGLDSTDVELLAHNVSIVFNSAATIKFEEPIKDAIKTNMLSIRHLLQVCQKMIQLAAVIHVSTAYSNCNRSSIEEIVYNPIINPSKVIEIFDNLNDEMAEKICPIILGEFPNTYTYTKFLAEYLFVEEGGNLPRAIIRPGAVTCAWEDPFPGWIDSWSVWGGFGIAMGLGITQDVCCNSKMATHIAPVDFCVNMFITAAREIILNKPATVKVYHCASGGATKITSGTFINLWTKYSTKFPLNNMIRRPSATIFRSYFAQRIFSFWDYYTFLCPMDCLLQITGNKPFLRKVYHEFSKNLKPILFFGTHEWQFGNNNTLQLWNSLTTEEKKIFNFDFKQIDWAQHLEDYVYGCKVYHMKENVSTLPAARRRYKILLWTSRFWNIFKWTLLSIFLRKLWNILKLRIPVISVGPPI